VTLVCEDSISKLVQVVTVAGVNVRIMLSTGCYRFGSKDKTFVRTLSTRFGKDFEVFWTDFELEFFTICCHCCVDQEKYISPINFFILLEMRRVILQKMFSLFGGNLGKVVLLI